MLQFPYRIAFPSRRWRPFASVRLLGPTGGFRDFTHAILDTGADDTVFPLSAAAGLGVVLEARSYSVRWRGKVYQLRFGAVELLFRDGVSVWRWPARVGFTPALIGYPLLGQSGVLEFFNAEFLGELRTAQLHVNGLYPGTIS